ncbi:hypothetical protein [Limnohabitans sp.]|uniref:hypothetical protein n=1 Tax=Limnohabitans sp. TaxID=1907725 RepID=UPI0025BB29DE|nr:hypothetical protein [Limnohabitans sp.]
MPVLQRVIVRLGLPAQPQQKARAQRRRKEMRVLQCIVLRQWLPEQPDQKTPTRQWREQMPLVRFDLDGERVPAFAFGEA